MIYRGTTPKHYFQFPFYQNEVESIFVSYWQQGSIKVEKQLNDVIFNSQDKTIEVDLSQEDTLSFEKYNFLDKARDSLILIQIRTKLIDGQCWVCEPIKERLGDVLKDGAI